MNCKYTVQIKDTRYTFDENDGILQTLFDGVYHQNKSITDVIEMKENMIKIENREVMLHVC